MFTDLEIKKINEIKNENINNLKIILANKATEMLHGKKAAQNSEQAAKEAFSGSIIGSNLPSIKIKAKEINNELNIINLVILSKLEKSKSEVRRLIKGNAIKINDKIISDEKFIIQNELFSKQIFKTIYWKKDISKLKKTNFFNFFNVLVINLGVRVLIKVNTCF